jgi:hypothetical protein
MLCETIRTLHRTRSSWTMTKDRTPCQHGKKRKDHVGTVPSTVTTSRGVVQGKGPRGHCAHHPHHRAHVKTGATGKDHVDNVPSTAPTSRGGTSEQVCTCVSIEPLPAVVLYAGLYPAPVSKFGKRMREESARPTCSVALHTVKRLGNTLILVCRSLQVFAG